MTVRRSIRRRNSEDVDDELLRRIKELEQACSDLREENEFLTDQLEQVKDIACNALSDDDD